MKNASETAALMRNLRLVLVRTNSPENIGMAARASANFGHAPLYLAEPRRWNYEKALPTATSQGRPLLDAVTVTQSVPEDRGLSNEDLENCGRLVTIPTAPDASSLNLAQAVLLMIYECYLALPDTAKIDAHPSLSRRVTAEERDFLFHTLKNTLMDIGTIPRDNPDHFFLPLARFFDRADLRRHEMDIFMGICRQMEHLADGGNEEKS